VNKNKLHTNYKRLLADVFTPVGIYLRLRDKFRDTVLLESTDFHSHEDSYSFIGVNAIGGVEIQDTVTAEIKLPYLPEEKKALATTEIETLLWQYMQQFEVTVPAHKNAVFAQSMFGYVSFDAVQMFEKTAITNKPNEEAIALMRYRLYQFVIVINHFKDELFICENVVNDKEVGFEALESLIRNKDVPSFPFSPVGKESSNLTDSAYTEMVDKGISSCKRGDVFQIVLSRKFEQGFVGDEFNVYRALRSINPSPYLFYFDYGDYKLLGSSPESQIIVSNGKAIVHPIAGTFKRTGNQEKDIELAEALKKDEKENAEHVMLVDLARNDLSRLTTNVTVTNFKSINYFSHVIHLVSEVTGEVKEGTNPFKILSTTFPAGTLSGAPKVKAMQLINQYETTARGYYGGAIGMVNFNGDINHAIMIRTFLSKQNTLTYQAGAGVVVNSQPKLELQEVNNKLNALKQAITMAAEIS
jgi:anthranilate synthase component I